MKFIHDQHLNCLSELNIHPHPVLPRNQQLLLRSPFQAPRDLPELPRIARMLSRFVAGGPPPKKLPLMVSLVSRFVASEPPSPSFHKRSVYYSNLWKAVAPRKVTRNGQSSIPIRQPRPKLPQMVRLLFRSDTKRAKNA